MEEFVREHDEDLYGQTSLSPSKSALSTNSMSLHGLQSLINVHIVNGFNTLVELHAHLDSLNLLDPNRLRPTWDTYFMV